MVGEILKTTISIISPSIPRDVNVTEVFGMSPVLIIHGSGLKRKAATIAFKSLNVAASWPTAECISNVSLC